MDKDQIILVNLSGRGDKDLGTVMHELWMTVEQRRLLTGF